MSLINFYTDDFKEIEIKPEIVQESNDYLYVGAIISMSFLFNPYVVIGSGICSAGYLYYKNYYNKPKRQAIELTPLFVREYIDDYDV